MDVPRTDLSLLYIFCEKVLDSNTYSSCLTFPVSFEPGGESVK